LAQELVSAVVCSLLVPAAGGALVLHFRSMTASMPRPTASSILALALLLMPFNASAAVSGSFATRKSLRPAATLKAPIDKDVVQPLRFQQELLVCNAYPSDMQMTLKQNGQAMLSREQNGLSFRDCKQVSTNIKQKDKLDFVLEGAGVEGTFEVGELPNSDATLLLVVERRDARTPLVAFQSFAFPKRAEGKDAQLAVIDTYKGNSSMPHLRMEDHIAGKEQRTVSKRVEQLNFNRIYAIEEGTYDASISDHVQAAKGGDMAMLEERVTGKRMLHMTKSRNYIVMRTGDDRHFPQSLVIFPPPEVKSSAVMNAPVYMALLLIAVALGVA